MRKKPSDPAHETSAGPLPSRAGDDSHALALKTMATWIAAIGNNVRNPLAGIFAATAILERQIDQLEAGGQASADDLRQSVGRIRDRLGSLNDYVGELIEFARVPRLQIRSIPLLETLDSVRHALAPLISLHGSLEIVVERGAENISADPQKLFAMLKALVANGYESVPANRSPKVLLRAFPGSAGGRKGICITVEDNGPGFAGAEISRVFEPFFSTREAGTGLGLAVVRKYIDAHDGAVDLSRSAVLQGAQVTLFFPDHPGPATTGRKTN